MVNVGQKCFNRHPFWRKAAKYLGFRFQLEIQFLKSQFPFPLSGNLLAHSDHSLFLFSFESRKLYFLFYFPILLFFPNVVFWVDVVFITKARKIEKNKRFRDKVNFISFFFCSLLFVPSLRCFSTPSFTPSYSSLIAVQIFPFESGILAFFFFSTFSKRIFFLAFSLVSALEKLNRERKSNFCFPWTKINKNWWQWSRCTNIPASEPHPLKKNFIFGKVVKN